MSKSNSFGMHLHHSDKTSQQYDLVCLSHLRWDFVYQRPQHLLSRFVQERRVFFFEEPIFGAQAARLDVSERDNGVWVVTPHLPEGISEAAVEAAQHKMIDDLFDAQQIENYVLWYYTPMALGFTKHLKPALTVYDCMDELAMFKGAPIKLKVREYELFKRAQLIFTGGQSLYEAKRSLHKNVHAFPSSIEQAHFGQARVPQPDPADQADILHPRLGFFGVVDERMDLDLLSQVADARPDWHLVIIGPVVKIDPASLPQRPNIHYLGGKSYKQLPQYLAGWDVALLPFARNDSTRFISPTKTPEYLAGGKPVVSTSIQDVVRPYGEKGYVLIADEPQAFVEAIEKALQINDDKRLWLSQVDAFLAQNSWDRTWAQMSQLIDRELGKTQATHQHTTAVPQATALSPSLAMQAGQMTTVFGSSE